MKFHLQVFNEISSRDMEQINVFKGMLRNYVFVAVLVCTVLFQFIIVEFLGTFASTSPLTLHQWFVSVFLGFLGMPIAAALKLIPVGSRWHSERKVLSFFQLYNILIWVVDFSYEVAKQLSVQKNFCLLQTIDIKLLRKKNWLAQTFIQSKFHVTLYFFKLVESYLQLVWTSMQKLIALIWTLQISLIINMTCLS